MGIRKDLRQFLPVAVLTAALVGGVQPAWAQAVGVMERARPDYDAKGLPLGAFRLRPSLDVGATSDSDVYRTASGVESDVYYTLRGAFDLQSDWSRHALSVSGSVSRDQYSKLDHESHTDWSLNADGRFDILREVSLNGSASYSVMHEPRSSPDQPLSAARPTGYAVFRTDAGFRYQPRSFGVIFDGSYSRFTYDPTEIFGAAPQDNTDRNRDQYQATATLSYEFSPGYNVFARGGVDVRRYDIKPDRNGLNRDSEGYRADLGLNMPLGHLVTGEIFAGYLTQNYQAPLSDVTGLDYGVNLDWYATDLMTLHLSAARTLTATTLANAAASDDRSVNLGVDYELLRNLILQGSTGYTQSRFVGTSRTDNSLQASLNARYLINRNLSLSGGYTYSRRNSTDPTQSFNDNLFSITLHGQD